MGTLKRKIELIRNSTDRLERLLRLSDDNQEQMTAAWWKILRRESWLHLKRTAELFWMVCRRRH